MKQRRDDYRMVPYPKYQRLAAAAYQTARHTPVIHGLLDVDVTRARAALREHKAKTGESLSFTAFLATCLAQAVEEHKEVQALHQGGRHLILFEDVDIAVRIEREVAGQHYVVPHIMRAANRKTFRVLHDEIREAQVASVEHDTTRFRYLPDVFGKPFFAAVVAIMKRRPRLWKQMMGTVDISSVGMFGTGAGWGIPASLPTALALTVGGVGEKLVAVDGHAEVREYLCLTISVDHNLVDGAPAARFTQRLKELIESGYGLADATDEWERTPSAREVSDVYSHR